MNILIIHPSFPGQFIHLAPYLARDPQNRVVFLAQENAIEMELPGVQLGLYSEPARELQQAAEQAGYLRTISQAVLEGQQIVRALYALRAKGFQPDIILGHGGWGSLLYVKDVYPEVPVVGYFEWYYHAHHSDSYWWPDEVPSIDDCARIRTRNAHHLLTLNSCDAGYVPTRWQRQQFPREYRDKLTLIHDGVDTAFCQPAEQRPGLTLPDAGLALPAGTEIITYVARGFEAFRGFSEFMDAMRIVLAHRPQCHVVLIGQDRVCYGPKPVDMGYQQMEEKKGGYDKARMHFVGLRNRGDYRKVLQASSVHVYLTRPFVLSWSALEAMSFGCPLVASRTPPVEEVVVDGQNGLLAEFRSPRHIASRVEELLDDRELAQRLGQAARQTVVERYELNKCLRAQEKLLYSLIKKA